jgi:hypothetical protein
LKLRSRLQPTRDDKAILSSGRKKMCTLAEP